MESESVKYGSRIKFNREGNTMVSHRIFDNGHKQVRVIIDLETMTFKFVDPSSGVTLREGLKKLNNLEVIQRHIKAGLQSYLGIQFEKEVRKVKKNV